MSISISMDEMLKAGVHYGHRKSKWHPKMKQFIYGQKNNIHILDLNKAVLKFADALNFIKESIKNGKNILFVGTKPQASTIVKGTAEKCGMPYVVNRWLGGTLTNFSTIEKRIKYLNELEGKLSRGDSEGYTKREFLGFTRQIEKMIAVIGGIRDLKKTPDVMFVTDINMDHIAVKEAKTLGIPLVGFADTNTDPSILDYVIPANDDSINSLNYLFDKISEAVIEGTNARPAPKSPAPKEPKKNTK